MINLDKIKLDTKQEEQMESLIQGLKVVQVIHQHMGVRGQLRVNNGNTAIWLHHRRVKGEADSHSMIHELSKILGIQFNKNITSQGFLKFEALLAKHVRIVVDTSECFYGGQPAYVDSKPRTMAYCRRPKTSRKEIEL